MDRSGKEFVKRVAREKNHAVVLLKDQVVTLSLQHPMC